MTLFQGLSFESPRGGISLEIEKTRTGTTSKLLVTRALPSDSGTYTCNPTRGQPTSADVHVITGILKIYSSKFASYLYINVLNYTYNISIFPLNY